MKVSIYSLIFVCTIFNIYPQTPIIDMYGNEKFGGIEGAYYKDINGFNDQYVGTWLYSNGNTKLRIVFIKKSMFYTESRLKNYYTDYLIGEIQYIENDIEKVNTLSNLNNNYSNIRDHSLYSLTRIFKTTYPLCPECGEDERRLLLNFNEPSRSNIWNGISNKFVIRTFDGQTKLKVQFVYTGNGLEILNSFDGPPANVNSFSVPYGEYIFVKQL